MHIYVCFYNIITVPHCSLELQTPHPAFTCLFIHLLATILLHVLFPKLTCCSLLLLPAPHNYVLLPKITHHSLQLLTAPYNYSLLPTLTRCSLYLLSHVALGGWHEGSQLHVSVLRSQALQDLLEWVELGTFGVDVMLVDLQHNHVGMTCRKKRLYKNNLNGGFNVSNSNRTSGHGSFVLTYDLKDKNSRSTKYMYNGNRPTSSARMNRFRRLANLMTSSMLLFDSTLPAIVKGKYHALMLRKYRGGRHPTSQHWPRYNGSTLNNDNRP